jgi:hypothetical protein
MYNIYHFRSERGQAGSSPIRKPNPVGFLKKKDMSHSLKGIIYGFVVVVLALISLGLFHGTSTESVPNDVNKNFKTLFLAMIY